MHLVWFLCWPVVGRRVNKNAVKRVRFLSLPRRTGTTGCVCYPYAWDEVLKGGVTARRPINIPLLYTANGAGAVCEQSLSSVREGSGEKDTGSAGSDMRDDRCKMWIYVVKHSSNNKDPKVFPER